MDKNVARFLKGPTQTRASILSRRYRSPLTDSNKSEQIKKEKREKVYLTGNESAGKRGQ